jgi:hypothetical protein
MHPAGPRSARTVGTASVVDSAQHRRRDFLLTGLSSTHGSMIAPLPNELEQRSDRRVMVRLSLGRARSWTGRSAVACATDSHLSRLTTAGTRVTRVSALRLVPVRADRFALPGAMLATGHATPLRRMDPEPPITSG